MTKTETYDDAVAVLDAQIDKFRIAARKMRANGYDEYADSFLRSAEILGEATVVLVRKQLNQPPGDVA